MKDLTKYYIDLSKLSEEGQKDIISLLPPAVVSCQYLIESENFKLHLTGKDWWVLNHGTRCKTELTYPEFIKLFEGGEGEKSFKNYIENQRGAFVRFISENYTVDKHLQLRTEIDSLLIAYDQMQNKLNSK